MTSNGTMTNGSKKRKASELESHHSGRPSKTKGKRHSKSAKSNAKTVEEIPFTPECPYKPLSKSNDDAFVQKEEIAPGFEFEFAVRPGMRWKTMRSYRNVKLQDHTFSVGSIIYINKQIPPPKSPRADATDAEILKYDRSNFWVGRIADTRAESDKAVFLRVYWLYWPEELPMGRQPYHGERELVLSNAMDIVDAQTISGAADLTHWDEKEDNNNLYRDRFWRQTFDISKLGKDRRGGLSELRKHCKCQQPHNPDKIMFQCKKPGCMTWNHEECLDEDVLQRAWSTYKTDGTLDALTLRGMKEEENESESSLRHRFLTPVRQLGKMMQTKLTPTINTVIEQSLIHPTEGESNGTIAVGKKPKPLKKPPPSTTSTTQPWDGKLKVQIINTDEKDDDSPILAEVSDTFGKKSKAQTKSWQIPVNCLVCGCTM